MYDHVLILLFQTVIWMLFHVFISLLWFLCIHINFYKSCFVSILDMYVWQMHFEHSLWPQSFMYDEIFVSLLLSLLSLIRISLELCYFLCLDSGLLSFRPTIFSTCSFIRYITTYSCYHIISEIPHMCQSLLSILTLPQCSWHPTSYQLLNLNSMIRMNPRA